MLLLLSAWLVAGVLRSDAQVTLESAPQLTLYSLAPEATPREKLDQKKTFHGWLIRSRVDVSGEKKSELLGKLYTAIAEDPAPARCFIPRHGIRAASGDRTVDLIICFECRQMRMYLDGKQVRGMSLGSSPQAFFDDVLRSTSQSGKSRTP